jgi:outer membrane protein
MANTIRTMTLVIASGLLAAPLMAQENLMDIYQRALQNDPAIREAEANYLAQAEAKPQARSNILPGLSFSGSKAHQFSQSSSPAVVQGSGQSIGVGTEFVSDRDQWGVSLTQTLFDWARFTQLKQADKRVMKAETDYNAAKQDLLIRVSDAYFNVLAAEDNLASAVSARESVARQLEQAQRRFDVGLIAITDVQQSQAGYDDAVATEIEAQRVLATSHEQLREIIGDIVTDLANPMDDLPLLTPDPANAEQWVQTALSQNLALLSSRINADIAQDDIEIQRAGRLPTLSLSAGYTDSTTDQVYTIFNPPPGGTVRNPSTSSPHGYNWSLDVRVPIFTGGLNHSRIQQSVYTHRAATETLERIARQTERQTRDSYLGVISKISQVRALRQSVESNRTALRATEAGFEVGTQTTVDVLQSQNNLRRAETSYSRSRYDYIMDVLRLKQAAGGLSVDDLQQVNGWLQAGGQNPAPAQPVPQQSPQQ